MQALTIGQTVVVKAGETIKQPVDLDAVAVTATNSSGSV